MNDHQDVPDTIFSSSPLRKAVHFNETISCAPQSATSISLLTSPSSTSLSFPLIAEKPGVRFKLCILLLSLLIALIVGFILSILLVTQLIHVPKHSLLSHRFYSTLSEQNTINYDNNNRLFEHLNSSWINQLDFSVDICDDFYSFVCRKWLTNHLLSPLDFKRSWLTERSQDIRAKFAEKLVNLSETEVYNHQMEINDKNQTEEVTAEVEIDGFVSSASTKNE
jgi:hypothetical protein